MLLSSSCMSDSEGNFLFSTDGKYVWNRNLEIMQYGVGLIGGGYVDQGVVVVPKPGSDHLYYIFVVPSWLDDVPPGFHYTVVDMNLDGGLGAVTSEKNVPLSTAWDAYEKVIALRHANDKDIWIITRKSEYDSYAAFLLTENGIEDTAVISYSPDRVARHTRGSMKVSYDKKYLIAAYQNNVIHANGSDEVFDICRFNANSGVVDFLYTLKAALTNLESPNSVEF